MSEDWLTHERRQELGRLGGRAASDKLTPEERVERARSAVAARWAKRPVAGTDERAAYDLRMALKAMQAAQRRYTEARAEAIRRGLDVPE